MRCAKCSQEDSLALPTMGRTESDDVAKVFVMASRGMDLKRAFEQCGSPTSWGNVQRRFKAMLS